MGNCNMCEGKGNILAEDKPKPVVVETVESANDVINQVASVEPVIITEEPQIKVDGKKTLYRRKKA